MSAPSGSRLGRSSAQDRVRTHVSGPALNSAADEIVVLQAYIDDSYNKNGVFVLAGYIASAESWAAFSKEWEEMLPHGVLDEDGRYHFKMSEMALNDDRMSRVSWFYRIIERHIIGYVSCKIDISELKGIPRRFYIPGAVVDWGLYTNPYYVTFRCLLDMFHNNRARMREAIPDDETIDFYFDEQAEKTAILAMWDWYINSRGEDVRKYYGATPRFEDDKEFLPLQAADLWAWWVRKWYTEGTPEKIAQCEFGIFAPEKKRLLRFWTEFNQEQLMVTVRRKLRAELGPGLFIHEFS